MRAAGVADAAPATDGLIAYPQELDRRVTFHRHPHPDGAQSMMKKKICMVGMFGVGKTSLVARFVKSIFSDKYLTTLGVKIDKKDVTVDGQDVTLMLWDLAGKDAVTDIKLTNLAGSSGYILVADGTRRSTLEQAFELQAHVEKLLGKIPFHPRRSTKPTCAKPGRST